MTPPTWLEHPLWTNLGLTLLHFVWQGALLALLLAVVLRVLRSRAPDTRYAACGAALVLMTSCPLITWARLRAHAATPGENRDVSAGGIQTREASPAAIQSRDPAAAGSGIQPHSQADLAGVSSPVPLAGEETLEGDRHMGRVVLDPWLTSDRPQHASPLEPVDHHPALRPGRQADTAGLPYGPRRLLAYAALVWCCGVTLLGVRLLAGCVALRRIRLRDAEPIAAAIKSMVERLGERLGIRTEIDIRASAATPGPVVYGLLKPVIVLPAALLTQCPPDVIEAMVAHELAHVRRHDLWVNLVQRLVETLLFYHPAVWWVSGRMRLERELCCDDAAVAATGSRDAYARALLEVSQAARSRPSPALAAAMLAPRMTLLARIRRVLGMPAAPASDRSWRAGGLALLLVGSVFAAAQIDTATAAADAPPDGQPQNQPTTAPADPRTTDVAQAKQKAKWAFVNGKWIDLDPPPPGSAQHQRELLQSAAAILDGFFAFRGALFNNSATEIQKQFRPNGRACSYGEVTLLREELERLGLIGRAAWWNVATVSLCLDPDLAVVVCHPFSGRTEKAEERYQTICTLGRQSGGWCVTRVARLDGDNQTEEWLRTRLTDRMIQWFDQQQAPVVELYTVTIAQGRMADYSRAVVRFEKDGTDPRAPLRIVAWDASPFEPFAPSLHAMGADDGSAAATAEGAPEAKRSGRASAKAESIEVRTLADGIVARIAVKPGQPVSRGDLLVQLDDEEIKIELQVAIVRREAARLEAARAKGLRDGGVTTVESAWQAETSAQLAELDVQRWELRQTRTRIVSPVDALVGEAPPSFAEGMRIMAGQFVMAIRPQSSSTAPASEQEQPK